MDKSNFISGSGPKVVELPDDEVIDSRVFVVSSEYCLVSQPEDYQVVCFCGRAPRKKYDIDPNEPRPLRIVKEAANMADEAVRWIEENGKNEIAKMKLENARAKREVAKMEAESKKELEGVYLNLEREKAALAEMRRKIEGNWSDDLEEQERELAEMRRKGGEGPDDLEKRKRRPASLPRGADQAKGAVVNEPSEETQPRGRDGKILAGLCAGVGIFITAVSAVKGLMGAAKNVPVGAANITGEAARVVGMGLAGASRFFSH